MKRLFPHLPPADPRSQKIILQKVNVSPLRIQDKACPEQCHDAFVRVVFFQDLDRAAHELKGRIHDNRRRTVDITGDPVDSKRAPEILRIFLQAAADDRDLPVPDSPPYQFLDRDRGGHRLIPRIGALSQKDLVSPGRLIFGPFFLRAAFTGIFRVQRSCRRIFGLLLPRVRPQPFPAGAQEMTLQPPQLASLRMAPR